MFIQQYVIDNCFVLILIVILTNNCTYPHVSSVGMHYKRINMAMQESITINNDTIDRSSNDFLMNCTSNPSYDKNIFFSKELRTTKLLTIGLDNSNLYTH